MTGRRTSCLLAQLSDPRYPGVLPGLELTSEAIVASANFFTCCGGSGLRLDPSATVTVACHMSQRLRLARKVYQTWVRQDADGAATAWRQMALDSAHMVACRQRLADIAASRSRRGLGWNKRLPEATNGVAKSAATATAMAPALVRGGTQQAAASPQLLSAWSVAMTAAWRFELKPHVVILGRTPAGEVLPLASGGAPNVLCIGGVDGLWEPHVAEQLETLIGYAYSSLVPVFVELLPRQQQQQQHQQISAESEKAYGNTKEFFAQRLARLKARSPLAWLEPSCVDKLTAVTDGLAADVAAAKRQRAAKQPRPAQAVRLPWDP